MDTNSNFYKNMTLDEKLALMMMISKLDSKLKFESVVQVRKLKKGYAVAVRTSDGLCAYHPNYWVDSDGNIIGFVDNESSEEAQILYSDLSYLKTIEEVLGEHRAGTEKI